MLNPVLCVDACDYTDISSPAQESILRPLRSSFTATRRKIHLKSRDCKGGPNHPTCKPSYSALRGARDLNDGSFFQELLKFEHDSSHPPYNFEEIPEIGE